MAILDDVKIALRVSNTALDSEINDLILAARQDLILSGVKSVKANSTTDALIKRAIVTYCKAYFGWDNPEAEKFQSAYIMLKQHLCLSQEYTV